MGTGRFDSSDWDAYKSTAKVDKATSHSDIFRSSELADELNPKGIKVRESCDSEANPLSTPIIVALDVTGSMGNIAFEIAKNGLNVLAKEIYKRKPVTDPHLMFMGIGDLECDRAPFQVTQFEASYPPLTEQLLKLYIEQGGGGNDFESYTLPWYFVANHCKIDSMIKRNKKGFLFTIGDEKPTPVIKAKDIERFFGYKPEKNKYNPKELLIAASRQWNIYHLIIEEGSYAIYNKKEVLKEWADILGQRVICISDHTKVAEVIVSILEVENGKEIKSVSASWDGTTAVTVSNAIKGLSQYKEDDGLIEF